MKPWIKFALAGLACLLFLAFWLSRAREDSVIRRSYLNLNASRPENNGIVRNTHELSTALKKYLPAEKFPQELTAIDFDNDYVILTSDKEVVRVWSKLGTKIVSLKRTGTNGIGLAIVRGKKEAYFKFTDAK
jgi:hypothetical protein